MLAMVSVVNEVQKNGEGVSMSLAAVPKTRVAVDAAVRLDSHLAHFQPVLEARFSPINRE
jgi:hypothetical protein